MLHAVIRSDRSALHFFGEVNGYNLQTLRKYVRHSAADDGPLQVHLRIAPDDQPAFVKHARRWVRVMANAGNLVRVVVAAHERAPQPVVRDSLDAGDAQDRSRRGA
jgi:hypothetical protein